MELVSIKFKFNWIAPIYTIDAPREKKKIAKCSEEIALKFFKEAIT